MNISIVIPCYNEAENVPALRAELWPVVQRLRNEGPGQSVELIFVDDGSRDNTASLIEDTFAGESDVRVVRHKANAGLGAALRTGFAAATGEIVITTDSDATYPFSEIEGLLSHLQPGVDIVTASPYHPLGGVDNVPGYRIFLSKGASAVYRVLVNRHLHTYTSMFRVYHRSVLTASPHEHDGFVSVAEILVRAMLNGARVSEHPCRLQVRRYGQSKAKVLKIIWAHLKFQGAVLAYRVGHFFGRKETLPVLVPPTPEER